MQYNISYTHDYLSVLYKEKSKTFWERGPPRIWFGNFWCNFYKLYVWQYMTSYMIFRSVSEYHSDIAADISQTFVLLFRIVSVHLKKNIFFHAGQDTKRMSAKPLVWESRMKIRTSVCILQNHVINGIMRLNDITVYSHTDAHIQRMTDTKQILSLYLYIFNITSLEMALHSLH